MKCQVTFRHMKPSEPIRQYAEEKIAKLHKVIDGDRAEAHVVLSVEKHDQLAHLELIVAGAYRARADERGEDIYACLDVAVDKLVKQVKRYRSKVRDSHREAAVKGLEVDYQVIDLLKTKEGDEEVIDRPQVVRQEKVVAKEMNLDDALIQMDLLNSDFLVFTNQKSQRMNVMYRLPDGQYGLIEATPGGG